MLLKSYIIWILLLIICIHNVYCKNDIKTNSTSALKNKLACGNLLSDEVFMEDLFVAKKDDSKASILVDVDNHKILYSKNCYTMKPIASLTKMMAMLLIVEALERGEISLRDTLKASTEASLIGGSQIYLREHEKMTIEDLFKSVIIKSANDATYLLGERLANGDIKQFVTMMNKRALQLGMNNTIYYYPHGLPPSYQDWKNKIPGNLSTCYDQAILGMELLKYPIITKYSSTWLTYIRTAPGQKKFQLRNTSRLIKDFPYFDGLKTGFYDAAGFCIAASAKKDGRRLLALVLGCRSLKNRRFYTKDLVMWGFDQIQKLDSLKSVASHSIEEQLSTKNEH